MAEGTVAPPQTFSISPRDLFTPLPEGFILVGFLIFLILLHSLSRTRFELDLITINRLLLGSVIFLAIMSLTELRGYLLAKSGRAETTLEAMA